MPMKGAPFHNGFILDRGKLETKAEKVTVIPAKAGIQGVYVIAPEGRDTMQGLDARFRGHDSEAGSVRPSSQATS
jgi:hypothetical protein